MTRCYFLLVGLLMTASLQAQVLQNRNSIRLGVDLTSLDAPDAVGLRYVGRLAHQFRNDRFLVAAEGGYITKTTLNQPFNEVDPGPNHRERFTADATVFFDFLPHPRHALRLGAGLSAWYRRDDTYRGAAALLAPTGLQGIAIDREERHELNTGGHVAVEYEWLFDPRWGVDVRLRLANLNQAGISSMLGTGISYRF
ncbi:hypothetical protein [Larkinella knui]|uniref:Outer membrane protein beta-barrel domain-containing protein n=1 Tax=Larkinella knui TaxID=2025310 RepID=A0A3P1CQG8_9BACT|nr:hypothetical protein [Larkinella knui]RRB15509.1 hypothetical protein EHT87_13365 [Larkinella knui]